MIQHSSFTLTPAHIALVRRMFIEWESGAYDGAPAVNLKRPYGNSDVLGDVAEIVSGWPAPKVHEVDEYCLYNSEGELVRVECANGDTYSRDDLVRLHSETATALQIILVTGEFEPGEYRLTRAYDARSWARW